MDACMEKNKMAVVAIKEITKSFTGVKALDHVSVEIGKGTTGLIGPNGSGKSTLFNCITGELKVEQGEIFLEDEKITNLESYQIAKKGVIRTYQDIQVFPEITVIDNLLTAGQHDQEEHFLGSLFKTNKVKALERELLRRAVEILDFLDLGKLAIEYAGNLSYGQRKLLSIGIGLISKPRLLLLDEPTAGVNPTMINHIVERLLELKRGGYSFCIIEHNIPLVMNLCDHIIVMGSGQKIAEGSPENIRENRRVVEEFFGRGA